MQALKNTAAAFGLELREVAPPQAPAAHEVIVDVVAAGICGSDVHIYDWSGGYYFLKQALPVTSLPAGLRVWAKVSSIFRRGSRSLCEAVGHSLLRRLRRTRHMSTRLDPVRSQAAASIRQT